MQPADGHSLSSLEDVFQQAKRSDGRPIQILARTVKGKGVSFMEGDPAWHSGPIPADALHRALKELA
jgi:transketolase